MAQAQGAVRDWLYLWMISTMLLGMLVLDLVPYYPESLWLPPSSPLHFLTTIREHYLQISGDPFFSPDHTKPHAPWFEVFTFIEGLIQLPLAVYLVFSLLRRGPASGSAEVAGLAFGSVTFMGAAACCYELWHMEDFLVDEEKKDMLLYGMYGPFAIVPGLMAVDMYIRLLNRISQADAKAKTQ